MATDKPDQISGLEFDDADVAQAYLRRPAYPDELIRRLIALAPEHRHALDLGCGPGKLAIPLSRAFERVTAIDPSAPMIALGRSLAPTRVGEIHWVCATSEDADFDAPVDLAVAGASLHWMTHGVLFPKLRDAMAPGARIAVVDGDGPTAAPWLDAYRALIVTWVERLGFVFNSPEFRARMIAHEAWIEIEGREAFTSRQRMAVEDLIEAEHSRATWARARMGRDAAEAFDTDLRTLLEPFADDDKIEFEVCSNLAWGHPRRTPR